MRLACFSAASVSGLDCHVSVTVLEMWLRLRLCESLLNSQKLAVLFQSAGLALEKCGAHGHWDSSLGGCQCDDGWYPGRSEPGCTPDVSAVRTVAIELNPRFRASCWFIAGQMVCCTVQQAWVDLELNTAVSYALRCAAFASLFVRLTAFWVCVAASCCAGSCGHRTRR